MQIVNSYLLCLFFLISYKKKIFFCLFGHSLHFPLKVQCLSKTFYNRKIHRYLYLFVGSPFGQVEDLLPYKILHLKGFNVICHRWYNKYMILLGKGAYSHTVLWVLIPLLHKKGLEYCFLNQLVKKHILFHILNWVCYFK